MARRKAQILWLASLAECAGTFRRAMAVFVRLTGPRFRLRSVASGRQPAPGRDSIVVPGGAPARRPKAIRYVSVKSVGYGPQGGAARVTGMRTRPAGTAPADVRNYPTPATGVTARRTHTKLRGASARFVPHSRRLAKRPLSGRGGCRINVVLWVGDKILPHPTALKRPALIEGMIAVEIPMVFDIARRN
jgi:hypothetical protein